MPATLAPTLSRAESRAASRTAVDATVKAWSHAALCIRELRLFAACKAITKAGRFDAALPKRVRERPSYRVRLEAARAELCEATATLVASPFDVRPFDEGKP